MARQENAGLVDGTWPTIWAVPWAVQMSCCRGMIDDRQLNVRGFVDIQLSVVASGNLQMR
jgi:hypothetical protein